MYLVEIDTTHSATFTSLLHRSIHKSSSEWSVDYVQVIRSPERVLNGVSSDPLHERQQLYIRNMFIIEMLFDPYRRSRMPSHVELYSPTVFDKTRVMKPIFSCITRLPDARSYINDFGFLSFNTLIVLHKSK